MLLLTLAPFSSELSQILDQLKALSLNQRELKAHSDTTLKGWYLRELKAELKG